VTQQTDVPPSQDQPGQQAPLSGVEHAHPGPRTYIKVAIWLAIATAAEVALYYVEMPDWVFIAALMLFMVVKFTTVVAYFMHLKYDSRMFRRFMYTGIILAISVYMIVLATFGLFR
jgi:cytochrome c oxidase subunit 4